MNQSGQESRVQEYKSTRVQEYKSTRVQEYKSTRVQRRYVAVNIAMVLNRINKISRFMLIFMRNYTSFRAILLTMVIASFLFTTETTKSQTPIIDCLDNITCGQAEPWKEYNYWGFRIDGCYINPKFRITKCCNMGVCDYIVDLKSITYYTSNCVKTPEQIRIEVIKFIMSKTPELFNIGYSEDFRLHLKQPKCMTDENHVFFGINYKKSFACDPNDCCRAVYQLASFSDKVRIIDQYQVQNDYVTCVDPVGTGCSYTCNSVDFTPPYLDILFSDYNSGGGDPCLADCFWRLDGNNNVTPQSFLGPTNNMPLILKTFDNSIMLAPNNIPTIEVSANPTARTDISGKVYINVSGTYNLPSDIGLAVGGKIIAEEVIVKLSSSWPDYVFSDDYDLIPLNQLESRIKERGALPGIPTAEEMQKDANIPIGEMNLKLLQKIEELTLYLIELENKNQGLEQRMKLLEGK
ncbi:MAG: hypothetical protein KGZ97_11640 [Bacteroidetes bacterium]|nr:hypothetical protein [Bacteroidota bacterium]